MPRIDECLLARSQLGVAIAVTVAGLFAFTPIAIAAKHEGKVHCFGVNSCKGKSECKTNTNACKGMNSCKGKGMLTTSEKTCKEKGGDIEGVKQGARGACYWTNNGNSGCEPVDSLSECNRFISKIGGARKRWDASHSCQR